MTQTFRTIIHVLILVLTATAGFALGASASGDSPGSGDRANTWQPEEAQHALVDRDTKRSAQAELELPESTVRCNPSRERCGRRLQVVGEMQREIAEIEALGTRIADWPGTDNDPLLDRLVAQRYEAILALVGGDSDLARRTLRHVSDGLGVVEAVQAAGAPR